MQAYVTTKWNKSYNMIKHAHFERGYMKYSAVPIGQSKVILYHYYSQSMFHSWLFFSSPPFLSLSLSLFLSQSLFISLLVSFSVKCLFAIVWSLAHLSSLCLSLTLSLSLSPPISLCPFLVFLYSLYPLISRSKNTLRFHFQYSCPKNENAALRLNSFLSSCAKMCICDKYYLMNWAHITLILK